MNKTFAMLTQAIKLQQELKKEGINLLFKINKNGWHLVPRDNI